MNASTLLLKLPQEIKDKIYEYICGGQFVHVHFGAGKCDGLPHHHICPLNTSNNDNHVCSGQICHTQDHSDKTRLLFHHEDCSSEYFYRPTASRIFTTHFVGTCTLSSTPTHFTDLPKAAFALDLRFLRTCRQIYMEAKAVLYSSNTFCLEHSWVFTKFFSGRDVKGALGIRNMRLSMTNGSWNGWQQCLREICKLQFLQKIRLEIESYPNRRPKGSEFTVLKNVKGDEVQRGLTALASMEFEEAAHAIRDNSILDLPAPVPAPIQDPHGERSFPVILPHEAASSSISLF